MILIDRPRFVAREAYDLAIENMVGRLSRIPGLLSIYQIGSVSTPGISDIDLLAVFDDNVECKVDPRGSLDNQEKYLFTHGLFGINASRWQCADQYAFFSPCRFLTGNRIGKEIEASVPEGKILTQIALEYMFKMLLVLRLQLEVGILKSRSLLLEIKALQTDLEIIHMDKSPVMEVVQKILKLREKWFDGKWEKKEFVTLCLLLFTKLEDAFLRLIGQGEYLYMPNECFMWGKIFTVRGHIDQDWEICKPILPAFPAICFTKRWFNLKKRNAQILLKTPLVRLDKSGILRQKLEWDQEYVNYNRKFLPGFLTLSSPLAKTEECNPDSDTKKYL